MSRPMNTESVDQLMREVGALVRSGMPLSEGLRSLAMSSASSDLGRAKDGIVSGLQQGSSLSEALAGTQPAPSPEFISLIRCGEQAGDLASVSDFAAETARRTLRTRAALESLTAYPITVMALVLAISSYMLAYHMPGVYDRVINGGLNFDSKIVQITYYPVQIGFHRILSLILGTISALMFAVIFLPPFRPFLWIIGQFLPGVRSLAQIGDFGTLMGFAGIMTARGVPLSKALEAASAGMATGSVRIAALNMAQAAGIGQPIDPYLPRSIPATAGLILAQAHPRGTPPETLLSLSTWSRDYFDLSENRALSKLEPVLIAFVAIFVALLTHAIYSPLIQRTMDIGKDL